MRNPVRAMTIAGTLSVLLGMFGMGCSDTPSTGTSSQGGAGGAGGTAGTAGTGGEGMGGGGGSSGCMDGQTQSCYTGAAGTSGVGQCKPGTATCSGGQWGACMGQVLPGAETCNGVDEDCNGSVDDGLGSQMCGVGACQAMVDNCVNGTMPTCEPGTPKMETCDGTDEDCDGAIDNGIDCPCTTEGEMRSCYSGGTGTAGVGECKAGTQTCTGGAWGACTGEVLPGTEACDAKDNDCDGQTDENIPSTTCGAGACLAMVPGCVNGAPVTCVPGQPTTEICNGIDDDCNFFIDDGLGTISCGVGACLVTVQACAGGQVQTCTPGMATNEICDGLDNNCNGSVDESNPGGGAACTTNQPGVCAPGVMVCTGGMLVCNSTTMASNETCDNKDNNCDGQTDEGNPGGSMPCTTGLQGVCAAGTTNCTNGGIVCVQTTQPSAELCDGLDNNCNGASDEGNPGSGGTCTVPGRQGPCAVGVFNCSSGAPACTQVTFPATESCNGIDDNCNGTVDEGNPGSGGVCSTMLPGVCSAGTFQCQNGALVCAQTTQSSTETCDNLDNNCNGTTDEGNPGGGGMCTTGLPGVCSAGTRVCMNGMLACNQNTQPSTEMCDNLDNNCNGTVDEGNPGGGGMCTTGLPGVCSAGTRVCTNGMLACNQNTQSSNETCDGLDNNCNGTSDEGNPGGGMACNTGQVGVCAAGTTACSMGAIVCNRNTAPSTESCDGLDNNCNGTADEGNPGGGVACSTGQLGVCAAGTTACSGGALACNRNTAPSTETCDGLDNDCNGTTDENNPGGGVACSTGQLGVCTAGTTACTMGMLACNRNTAPSTEMCDGLDNNCNGATDEGNPGGGTACTTGQLGVCSAGTRACMNGTLVCNQNTQQSAETCDGLDNNCNGTVDEGNPGSGGSCNTGLPGVCAPGTYQCQGGMLRCISTIMASAEICDGLDNDCNGTVDNGNPGGGGACATGLSAPCANGVLTCTNGALACTGPVTVYEETFATATAGNNWNGWTLGTEWQIGTATASTGHQGGNPDPSLDHSPSADNKLAGVVIGGNASIAASHGFYYLTSPIINTSGTGAIMLDFWRWLNSDWYTWMVNSIEVYNGTAWVTIWSEPHVFVNGDTSETILDAAWTNVTHDLTTYKNANMRVRFGFKTQVDAGSWFMSSWNLDDFVVRRCQ